MKDDDQEEVLFDVMRATTQNADQSHVSNIASAEFNNGLADNVVSLEASKKAAAEQAAMES